MLSTTQTIDYPDLAHFTGTEQVYHNSLNTICYTDGVRYLARQAAAYWLIDAISSYQPQLLNIPRLRDFQMWIFSQKPGKALEPAQREFPRHLPSLSSNAVLSCWYDSPADWHDWTRNPLLAVRQDIPLTDFPLAEVKFYVCMTAIGDRLQPLLLLPSEY